jgi:long-chain acyl-CoA synthetase
MGACSEPLLPSYLALHAIWRAQHPAVIAPEGTRSWAAFDASANRIAHALLAGGLEIGDRVGIVMSNRLVTLETYWGVLKAGGVVVPLNVNVTDDSLCAMLRDAGANWVIATDDHVSRLHLLETVRAGACIVHRNGDAPPLPGWRDFGVWCRAHPTTPPAVELCGTDLCNIIYSSGTTGAPKGIVHTHAARLAWAYDVALALRCHKGARTLAVTGLYSNITWASMLATILVGGTLVLRPGFDAAATLATIERERITHAALVPILLQRLLEAPEFETTDLDAVEMLLSVGSPLPAGLKARLLDRFPTGLLDAYGTTEGILTTLEPEEAKDRLASVGRPLPGADLCALGPQDRRLPPGRPGEIACHSRWSMEGYWQKPEATAEAIWIDPAGRRWIRSGDIGVIDADGYLQIVDRKKDMILSGGQNIYPADIEAVLRTHEHVFDCAVIGIPSERWGETPLALVVLRDGQHVEAAALRDWLNERLGKQQRVHAVELRSDLPRNANGKLLKRELRTAYWMGTS